MCHVNWQNLLFISNINERAKVIELFINVIRFSESETETPEEAVLNSVKNQFSHFISHVKKGQGAYKPWKHGHTCLRVRTCMVSRQNDIEEVRAASNTDICGAGLLRNYTYVQEIYFRAKVF